ncbi:MAG: hypothetical protein K5751_07785 [Treponemataceae bacterium]|nr:hypothetical protein [Treponemataceae bacterium]
MNNEQIKQLLLKIEKTDVDFTVTMTGKASKAVNGLYRPTTHEILLHNKNFTNENSLVYTAIHEYTHHLLTAADERKAVSESKRTKHDSAFWSKMDDLIEVAVKQGVYVRKRSEKLTRLIDEAKQIDREIAGLKKKLGSVLKEIHRISEEEGTRFEDVLTHDIRMQKTTAEKCIRASNVGKEDVGQDIQEVLSKTANKTANIKDAAETAVDDGKTVEQLKYAIQTTQKKPEDKREKLEKEKTRLEKTITSLNERLSVVMEALESL